METNAGEHRSKTPEQRRCGLRTRTANQAQAAQLLDAWIAGDRRRLDQIFSQFRETDLIGEGQGDREELLLCIALQMKSAPSLFEPRIAKPQLGVWIDMLTHLAGCGLETPTIHREQF